MRLRYTPSFLLLVGCADLLGVDFDRATSPVADASPDRSLVSIPEASPDSIDVTLPDSSMGGASGGAGSGGSDAGADDARDELAFDADPPDIQAEAGVVNCGVSGPPETIDPSTGAGYALALDETHAYYAFGGSLRRRTKASGLPEILVSQIAWPVKHIAVGPSLVYYAGVRVLISADKDGGATRVLHEVDPFLTIEDVAWHIDTLYLSVSESDVATSGGKILALKNGKVSEVMPARSPRQILVSGNVLTWASYLERTLSQWNLTTHKGDVLLEDVEQAESVAVAPGYAFVAGRNGVVWVAQDTKESGSWAAYPTGHTLVADSRCVYMSAYAYSKTYVASHAGGALRDIASTAYGALAVDERHLYALSQSSSSTSLVRYPKSVP